jgi:hypothetical protein
MHICPACENVASTHLQRREGVSLGFNMPYNAKLRVKYKCISSCKFVWDSLACSLEL